MHAIIVCTEIPGVMAIFGAALGDDTTCPTLPRLVQASRAMSPGCAVTGGRSCNAGGSIIRGPVCESWMNACIRD